MANIRTLLVSPFYNYETVRLTLFTSCHFTFSEICLWQNDDTAQHRLLTCGGHFFVPPPQISYISFLPSILSFLTFCFKRLKGPAENGTFAYKYKLTSGHWLRNVWMRYCSTAAELTDAEQSLCTVGRCCCCGLDAAMTCYCFVLWVRPK